MIDKRTLKQNRYRWGVVVDTVLQEINKQLEKDNSEYRATPEDIDIFIKDKALGLVHKVNTSLGEITITGKLRTRSTKDFEELCFRYERTLITKESIYQHQMSLWNKKSPQV